MIVVGTRGYARLVPKQSEPLAESVAVIEGLAGVLTKLATVEARNVDVA